MGFFSDLEQRARQVNSLLCVGLDPHPAELPGESFADSATAARDFCLRLIDATHDLALAFKPNSAFFEAYGPAGIQALHEVVAAVPAGIPVILDAKRGDIASTAEAYARAAFETLGAHALTASPYLGRDALEPLLRRSECGVFVLCKTSNPGAADVQDLHLAAGSMGAQQVYEAVALQAVQWNRHDNLGLVVGATQPQALRRVRALAPEMWFLAPGVGAQGGDLQTALQAGLRADGLGMLIPVSRAISGAPDARQAAQQLVQAINAARAAVAATPPTADPAALELRQTIADGLLRLGCVRFGQFTLKSGLQSPIYLDLRQLVSDPALLALVGRAYADLLRGLRFDRLAALPYAALPIGTAISLHGGWPMIYARKEAKTYGTMAEIEGQYAPGEQVVIIDDLATTGGSKFEALERLAAAGLAVQDVVVLIDRQSGAAQALAERGCRLHAVFTLTQLLDDWQAQGRIPADQIAAARQFIAGSA